MQLQLSFDLTSKMWEATTLGFKLCARLCFGVLSSRCLISCRNELFGSSGKICYFYSLALYVFIAFLVKTCNESSIHAYIFLYIFIIAKYS